MPPKPLFTGELPTLPKKSDQELAMLMGGGHPESSMVTVTENGNHNELDQDEHDYESMQLEKLQTTSFNNFDRQV